MKFVYKIIEQYDRIIPFCLFSEIHSLNDVFYPHLCRRREKKKITNKTNGLHSEMEINFILFFLLFTLFLCHK